MLLLSVVIEKGQDVLFVNGHHTQFLDWFFRSFTYVGDGILFVPAILLALFIRFQNAVILSAIGIVNGLGVSLFKKVFFSDAERPVRLLDHDLLHYVPGVDVHSHFSFPSGHTASIFALVAFLSLASGNRYWTVLFTIIALLVGYSRIYLLQHFLLDVTGGAILGSAVSISTYMAFANQRVPAWMKGRIRLVREKEDVQPSGN